LFRVREKDNATIRSRISTYTVYTNVNKRIRILIRSNKMQQMQVFITANLLYMFRASIDPIIRSKSNCNYSLWYRS